MIIFSELEEYIKDFLAKQPPRESEIFLKLQTNTLDKISVEYSMSKERTRQIFEKVFRSFSDKIFFGQILKNTTLKIMYKFTFEKRFLKIDVSNLKYIKTFKRVFSDFLITDNYIVDKKFFEYFFKNQYYKFKTNYYINLSEFSKEIFDYKNISYFIYKDKITKSLNGFVMSDILEGNVETISDEYVFKNRISEETTPRAVRSFLSNRNDLSKLSAKTFVPNLKISNQDLDFLKCKLLNYEINVFSKTILKDIFSIIPYPFDSIYYAFKEKFKKDFIFSEGNSMNISKKGFQKIEIGGYKIWDFEDWEANYGKTKSVFQFSRNFYPVNNGGNVLEISDALADWISKELKEFDFTKDKYFYASSILEYLDINVLFEIEKNVYRFPLSVFTNLYDGDSQITASIKRITVKQLF